THEVAGMAVPEIVNSQPGDFGGLANTPPRVFEIFTGAALAAGENPRRAVAVLAQPAQQWSRRPTQRNVVVGFLFRHGVRLDPYTGRKVELLPGRGQHLIFSSAG